MFDGEAFGRQIVESVKGHITRELGPILERLADVEARTKGGLSAEIAALDKRLARIEARPPALRYLGVWQTGTTYTESSCVTWDGSMWVARETTTLKPGAGCSSWVLAVKRGQDAK
jgi:hypothetical protein